MLLFSLSLRGGCKEYSVCPGHRCAPQQKDKPVPKSYGRPWFTSGRCLTSYYDLPKTEGIPVPHEQARDDQELTTADIANSQYRSAVIDERLIASQERRSCGTEH